MKKIFCSLLAVLTLWALAIKVSETMNLLSQQKSAITTICEEDLSDIIENFYFSFENHKNTAFGNKVETESMVLDKRNIKSFYFKLFNTAGNASITCGIKPFTILWLNKPIQILIHLLRI